MKSIMTFVSITLLAAGMLLAQSNRQVQFRGGQGWNGNTDKGPEITIITIEGAIEETYLDQTGIQYPVIQVDGKLIKIAPLWYLEHLAIELEVGDNVRVEALPCERSGAEVYRALSLTLLDESGNPVADTIVFRLVDDKPSWAGRGYRNQLVFPQSAYFSLKRQAAGDSLLPASEATVTGVVDQIVRGKGFAPPVLLLRTPDGQLLDITIGPADQLLAWDFELKEGQTVMVRFALTQRTRQRIALQLADTAGNRITLRNERGDPIWP